MSSPFFVAGSSAYARHRRRLAALLVATALAPAALPLLPDSGLRIGIAQAYAKESVTIDKLTLPTKTGRGDLFALLKVVMPPTATAEVKALWQALSDKASFDLHVTVPDGLTVAGNGELEGVESDEGGSGDTWTWSDGRSQRFYNCAFGYYGFDPLSAGGLGTGAKWMLILAGRQDTEGPSPRSASGFMS